MKVKGVKIRDDLAYIAKKAKGARVKVGSPGGDYNYPYVAKGKREVYPDHVDGYNLFIRKQYSFAMFCMSKGQAIAFLNKVFPA